MFYYIEVHFFAHYIQFLLSFGRKFVASTRFMFVKFESIDAVFRRQSFTPGPIETTIRWCKGEDSGPSIKLTINALWNAG
jgi:hypothetical protein